MQLVVFAFSVVGGPTYFIGFAIGGFFLYKSATSLVALNRITPEAEFLET
ncbi:MAG: hypothetical protein OK422_01795 [Thaumarchaeota archaeon]|nr:hypothetical protein [Nitrososphaerota archaeon]